jgi:hypothetical protein
MRVIVPIMVLCVMIAVFAAIAWAAVPVELDYHRYQPNGQLTAADQMGNTYPPQCYEMHGLEITILFEPPHVLDRLDPDRPPGMHTEGRWQKVDPVRHMRDGIIYIDNTLQGWIRSDVLRHELCHATMWRLTGDYGWHK